jgi:hypothetical protein
MNDKPIPSSGKRRRAEPTPAQALRAAISSYIAIPRLRRLIAERGDLCQALREYPAGEGTLPEIAELKIDPNAVKQLSQGECVVISGGRAQHIMVSPVTLPRITNHTRPPDGLAGSLPAVQEVSHTLARSASAGATQHGSWHNKQH